MFVILILVDKTSGIYVIKMILGVRIWPSNIKCRRFITPQTNTLSLMIYQRYPHNLLKLIMKCILHYGNCLTVVPCSTFQALMSFHHSLWHQVHMILQNIYPFVIRRWPSENWKYVSEELMWAVDLTRGRRFKYALGLGILLGDDYLQSQCSSFHILVFRYDFLYLVNQLSNTGYDFPVLICSKYGP